MNTLVNFEMTKDEFDGHLEINTNVPGYSTMVHYEFFKKLLQRPIRNLLMLGVYYGRDICYILNILKHNWPERYMVICGVDRFTDEPCQDWTLEQKQRGWIGGGHGNPPNDGMARINTFWRNPNINRIDVSILRIKDYLFLERHPLQIYGQPYDCFYLDTSHDEATVTRQIKQCQAIASPDAVFCGDDWTPEHGTWGVKQAVEKSFSKFEVFHDRVWLAELKDLR